MDTFEDKSVSAPEPASTSASTSDLQGQLESVKQLIISTLVLVMILSGTLNIFLWRQFKSIRDDLAPLKPQATQIIAECNRVNGMAQEVAKRLVEYGRTHPDFQPTLTKYGLSPTNAPRGTASTTLTPPAKK